jgi:hypothetical protein
LPDYRAPFQLCSQRTLRVRKTVYDHEIDLTLANDGSKPFDFSRHTKDIAKVKPWIQLRTQTMQGHLDHFHARGRQSVRGIAVFTRNEDDCVPASFLHSSIEPESLIMWASKDWVVDRE